MVSRAARRQERQETKETERRGPGPVKALNRKQEGFLHDINRKAVTVAWGPAGTSKTYLPTVRGLEMVLDPSIKIDKLIVTRPAVAACGERHGFLPGTLEKKVAPWAIPVLDVLEERLGSKNKLEAFMKDGHLEFSPFGFMRGRTLKNAFILLDEAQNTTVEQMRLFLTRLGENVKVVVSGDVSGGQNDLGTDHSGLHDLVLRVQNDETLSKQVALVQFTSADVVRSGLCQLFVKSYEATDDLRFRAGHISSLSESS